MARRLYLIDGSSYFYRAFFAVRGLSNSKGLPTNAAFGFTNMVLRILRVHKPDALGMVFDAPGKTFRDEIYDEYKATRDATPEDLIRQIPYMKDITRAFKIETAEVPGVEADDVLCTLALQGMEKGYDVVIVTGDKDFMQVVTKEVDDPGPGITLYDDMKERRIGIAQVVEKFGVKPANVIDVLALMGDTSDNIPGVKGIGPKFASQLISEYGSLEELLKDPAGVKPARFRGPLEAGREKAVLSRTLATIKTDVDVAFDEKKFARQEWDREKLAKIFNELEFSRLLQELQGGDAPKARTISFEQYRLVTGEKELRALAEELGRAKTLSVDLETTSTDAMRAQIVGIALCAEEGKAVYVATGHRYLGAPEQVPLEKALETLRPVLENDAIRKVGQNLKYDLLVFARAGVDVRPVGFDTMVGAYLSSPEGGPYNLDTLAKKHLSHDMIPFSEVAGKGKSQVTFDQVPVERARDYACEDADAALRLVPILEQRVRDEGVVKLLEEMELPLIGVLLKLERNGIRIDSGHFSSLGREFEKKMSGIMKEAFRVAGEEFNLDSPKQLQRILFDKLGLTPGKKTKTGYSTDMSVLEKLSGQHELPARILEYRTLAKLKNTYIDALPDLVNPETGRIHTSYNQAVAATGRLSSSDPNLQNIPIRTAEGRLIRKGFVPEKGCVYVGADYSQVELRVLAHLSGDERLRDAFAQGQDIHASTAQEIFGSSEAENRRRAKAINFGIIYGMSAFGLSQRLGIDPREAQDFITLYFSRYPKVKGFLDGTLEEGRKRGYVQTMFDRRRYVADLNSKNSVLRNAAERVAINAPIQGTAADLMKMAMIRVSGRLEKMKSLLILQVHDELVLESPKGEVETAQRMLREEMENVYTLSVPLRVDVSQGATWADMK